MPVSRRASSASSLNRKGIRTSQSLSDTTLPPLCRSYGLGNSTTSSNIGPGTASSAISVMTGPFLVDPGENPQQPLNPGVPAAIALLAPPVVVNAASTGFPVVAIGTDGLRAGIPPVTINDFVLLSEDRCEEIPPGPDVAELAGRIVAGSVDQHIVIPVVRYGGHLGIEHAVTVLDQQQRV